jgi:site-specific DNA-methyltransferase (cytosine-N4-specific)
MTKTNKPPYFNKVFFKSSEVMAELPDNSVDLIITSPPYWDIKDYSKDGGHKYLKGEKKHSESDESDMGNVSDYSDYIDKCLVIWKECYRVLKPNGKLCLNVPTVNHRKKKAYSISFDMRKSIFRHTHFQFFNLVVWYKKKRAEPFQKGSFPFPGDIWNWFGMTEDIIILVKPGPEPNPEDWDEEIGKQSALTRDEWYKIINPIWEIVPPQSRTGGHSAVMSIEVVERLVKAYSFVGGLVLDPFTGSGTTLLGAKKLNRNWVGYELYPFYKKEIEKTLGEKLDDSNDLKEGDNDLMF